MDEDVYDELIQLIAEGNTPQQCAQELGLWVKDIRAKLKDPQFQILVAQRRLELNESSIGVLAKHESDSVKTLVDLQDVAMPPAVRAAAAKSLLEMAVRLREEATHRPAIGQESQRVVPVVFKRKQSSAGDQIRAPIQLKGPDPVISDTLPDELPLNATQEEKDEAIDEVADILSFKSA